MDKVIQGICYSFSRLFQRVERYTIIVVLMGILFSGKITPTETFDTSVFDTLRLGDQITSDVLEQLRAFQAILNQPIALGLLVRGGVGSPGPSGSPGNTGGRGTMGDQGPVGENGSAGIEGSFGKTGAPGLPGEPGTPGYERTYDGNVNYANEERNDRGDYGNEEASNPSAQERNYSTDQSVSEETKIFCEGERSWIGCNQNEKINITNAFWGRDDFVTCSQSVPSNHSTRQYSLDYDYVLMKVKGICNWRPTCEFYATRLFLDDVTDLQVYKYLRVGYECIPEVYDMDNFGERRGNTEEQLSGMRNDTTLWTP